MEIPIIQGVLAFTVSLSALFILRNKKGITLVGWVLVALGAVSSALSVYAINLDQKSKQIEPYRFRLSDIGIILTAENLGSHQPDSTILAGTPKAFSIEYVFAGSAFFQCDFSRLEAVTRPYGYRAPNRATLVYNSSGNRRNQLSSNETDSYRYHWDLNGAKIRFHFPASKFKSLADNHPWRFKIQIRIGEKSIEHDLDDSGEVNLTLSGFSRDDYLKEF